MTVDGDVPAFFPFSLLFLLIAVRDPSAVVCVPVLGLRMGMDQPRHYHWGKLRSVRVRRAGAYH